jgi:hypothetical protein
MEELMALKFNPTGVAAIGINGHSSFSLIAALIIACQKKGDKRRDIGIVLKEGKH